MGSLRQAGTETLPRVGSERDRTRLVHCQLTGLRKGSAGTVTVAAADLRGRALLSAILTSPMRVDRVKLPGRFELPYPKLGIIGAHITRRG